MSVNKQVKLHYTLEMLSGFHIGSGTGVTGLVDRAVMRSANHELIVPGSTLKGRVRHHAEQVARSFGIAICGGRANNVALCKPESYRDENICLICRLFGSEWQPGTLFFSDARLIESLRDLVHDQHAGASLHGLDYQVNNRSRTRINRVLRRVEEGALFSSEEGTAGLIFTSQIQGVLQCVETEGINFPIPLELVVLVAALRLVESVGGNKTIGLGRCRIVINELNIQGSAFKEDALNVVLSESLEEEVALYDVYRTG